MANKYCSQHGFSLFELVLGIALLGILMVGAVAMLINLAPRTVDPAMEVRAAQLAQRLLNDISLQKFDHANNNFACGTADGNACTEPAKYGPDIDGAINETSLATFNDVDDYDTAAICSISSINAPCEGSDWIAACWFTDESCSSTNNVYSQFSVKITVSPAEFETGTSDAAKSVEVAIRQPNGNQWDFAVLRGNYP